MLFTALKHRFPLTDGIIFKFNSSHTQDDEIKDKTLNKITVILQMLQYLFDEKLNLNCV